MEGRGLSDPPLPPPPPPLVFSPPPPPPPPSPSLARPPPRTRRRREGELPGVLRGELLAVSNISAVFTSVQARPQIGCAGVNARMALLYPPG